MTTETLPASAGKQTVVLLHGGRSSEHEISCVTTAGIFSAIDRERFDVVLVGITKAGQTVLLGEGDLAGYALDAAELPQVRDNGTRVLWPLSPGDRNLTVIGPDGRVQPVAEIDVVFPVLHGPFGEDGTVQGMLELVDVPYVGAGVLASSLCMDKHFTKLVLAESGIRVAPGRTIRRGQLERNPELLAQADAGLSYPLFVKPLRAGSSVGVSRVAEAAEIPAALDLAFESDDAVLIESGVVGREVEIAVLGGRAGQSPRASAVAGEIVMNGDGFYDYEAKYLDSSRVQLQLPAQLSDAELASLRETAVAAFEATGCEGLARVDFFLTAGGPVVNEVNTLPGFTPFSMYPKLWEASGLAYTDLITELIELALEGSRAAAR